MKTINNKQKFKSKSHRMTKTILLAYKTNLSKLKKKIHNCKLRFRNYKLKMKINFKYLKITWFLKDRGEVSQIEMLLMTYRD